MTVMTGRVAGLCMLCALFLSGAAAAVEIAGVRLAEQVQLGRNGPGLVLNGAGVRTHMLFKVYVAALYLPAKSSDSGAILQDNQPSRLVLHILRNLTSDQIISSMLHGMQESLTPEQRLPLELRMQQFSNVLQSLPEIRKGTQVVIDYTPQAGTVIRMDGNELGRIAGADFNSALLRVWIGEKPRDERLKRAMLGS